MVHNSLYHIFLISLSFIDLRVVVFEGNTLYIKNLESLVCLSSYRTIISIKLRLMARLVKARGSLCKKQAIFSNTPRKQHSSLDGATNFISHEPTSQHQNGVSTMVVKEDATIQDLMMLVQLIMNTCRS